MVLGTALKTAALDALHPKIDAAETVGSVRLISVRHEFATEWARFVPAAPAADGLFPLTVPLRQEHYPYWAPEDLGLNGVELFASAGDELSVTVAGDPQGRLRTGRPAPW